MKLKKIAAACRNAGALYLLDRIDAGGAVEQWISCREAMWPVRGLPYMTVDNLATLLELSAKQMEKMVVTAEEAPERIDLRDAVEREWIADELDVRVIRGGKELMAVELPSGAVYLIDTALLEPVEAKADDVRLFLRRQPDGTPYFAVKAGLLLVGIAGAMEAGNLPTVLRRIADGCDMEGAEQC